MLWLTLAQALPDRQTIPSVSLSAERDPPKAFVEMVEDVEVQVVPLTRSEWTAIEVCWISEEIVWSLPALETLLRSSFEHPQNTTHFLRSGVQVSLTSTMTRMCLQLQGAKTNVFSVFPFALALLEELPERRHWEGIRTAYADDVQRQDQFLALAHRVGTNYVLGGQRLLAWEWNFHQIRRDFSRFWKASRRKMVAVGNVSIAEGRELGALLIHKRKERQSSGGVVFTAPPIKECSAVLVEGARQIAVTLRLNFPDLNRQELRYLAQILGGTTQSRLGRYLREELGLVYTIGARSIATGIEVSYTIDPPMLLDSINAVKHVVESLDIHPATDVEWAAARGVLIKRYRTMLEDYAQIANMYSLYSRPEQWTDSLARTWSVEKSQLQQPLRPTDWRWVLTGSQNGLHLWYDKCGKRNRQQFHFSEIGRPVYVSIPSLSWR